MIMDVYFCPKIRFPCWLWEALGPLCSHFPYLSKSNYRFELVGDLLHLQNFLILSYEFPTLVKPILLSSSISY